MNLEHIGIAVKDLEKANKLYASLLGKKHYKTEEVTSENVLTSFFKTNSSKIELLQPTNKKSAIAKFITKNGEGIHHIAFEVSNIHKEINRLQKEGFTIINNDKNSGVKKGADNKLVAFLNPKTTNGVLIELCQTIN